MNGESSTSNSSTDENNFVNLNINNSSANDVTEGEYKVPSFRNMKLNFILKQIFIIIIIIIH